MRRFLTLFLALALVIPTTSVAKEDKKAPAKSSAAAASEKSTNTNNTTNKSDRPVDSKSEPVTKSPSTSSTSTNAPGNSGNTPNNTSGPSTNPTENSAKNPVTPNSSGSTANSNNSSNEAKPENPNKPETTGKPEETGKPESTGKPETPGKKEVALEEGESKNFVVRFRDDASIASEATNLRAQDARVARTFNNVFKGLSATLNSKQLEALKKNPRVELIEEDIQVKTTATQSNATWGLDRIDQRALPLDGTFSYASFGSTVRAYVIDTGIRSSHQEFVGRIQSGYSAISDGRGTDDCNGHGTHVAGTVAGTTFGVSKSATLIPVRVLGCDGNGTLSGVIAGLDWIAANHPSGAPAVANMSLGSGASSILDSAVNNLINRGITVVVAAGNSADSACNYSPARVPAAITVAASTINDQLAWYSNHGSCVDLIAPGSSITSAWISSDAATAVLNGTSMASPHVAGSIVALFASGYLSPSNIDLRIKSLATVGVITSLPSGTPNSLLFSVTETSTGGDESSEPVAPPAPVITVPSAPRDVAAVAAKRSAQISWLLAENDGGSPVTSQLISVLTGGKVARTLTVTGTVTAATVRTLNPRLSYTFVVTAINSIGQGPASTPSNAITPLR